MVFGLDGAARERSGLFHMRVAKVCCEDARLVDVMKVTDTWE